MRALPQLCQLCSTPRSRPSIARSSERWGDGWMNPVPIDDDLGVCLDFRWKVEGSNLGSGRSNAALPDPPQHPLPL
jgi:hypothetical protein